MIFFNLSTIKALLQDSKGDIHSLFLCGEFIWLFSLEICPVSFIFTWCFCRVPEQGNHSPNHWVTWSAQVLSNISSSVTSAPPKLLQLVFGKRSNLNTGLLLRMPVLPSSAISWSKGRRAGPGLHQEEQLWSEQPQTWCFSFKNAALVSVLGGGF